MRLWWLPVRDKCGHASSAESDPENREFSPCFSIDTPAH